MMSFSQSSIRRRRKKNERDPRHDDTNGKNDEAYDAKR